MKRLLSKYRQICQERLESTIKQSVKDQFSHKKFYTKALPLKSTTVTYDHLINWQSIFGPSVEGRGLDIPGTIKVTQINCNPRLRHVSYSDSEMPLFNQAIETRCIDRYTVNIREIDGLGAGKCLPSNCETLDDLALNIIGTLNLPEDPAAALKKALAHREIRLIHTERSESVIKMAWDNRMYLRNVGGSHHFTVARYLAEKLQKSAEFNFETSYLAECSLNPEAVWQIQKSYNLVALDLNAITLMSDFLNDFHGHCYRSEFLDSYTQLYIFPKDNVHMTAIAEGLKEIGHYDVNKLLSELLELQDKHQLIQNNQLDLRHTEQCNLTIN